MIIPSAIVFVSNNIVDQIRDTLIKQLYITDVMDGYNYDQAIIANPNYPQLVKYNNRRLMVVRSFAELQNRETADVVLFVSHGNVSIEQNKFGPPDLTYRIAEVHWGKLCVFPIPINCC